MKSKQWPRTGVLVVALLLGASLACAQGTQLLVSNVQVQVQQPPPLALVDVTYDLETVGDVAVTVNLFLSTDSGGTYPHLCQTVSGDVGAGVLPGSGKQIVWDAGADFPGFSSATCRLRVTADDEQIETRADFVTIPPGVFTMGSPTTEPGRFSNETQHEVTLTHGIDVQTTEVTNQQYMELAQWAYDHGYATVMDEMLFDNLDGSTQLLSYLTTGSCEITFNAGVFSCISPTHPVKYVSWYGSVAYCDWLSMQQGLARAYDHSTWQCNGGNPYTAVGYRLSTEAEWEYACRAGTQTPFNTGTCLDAGTEANYDGNWPYTGCPSGPYVDGTVPVGSYPANGFGLYDMHGNEAEWCSDWYDLYGGPVTDPVGPEAGSHRVLRGGGWYNQGRNCRSAIRFHLSPGSASDISVFRPVRSVDVFIAVPPGTFTMGSPTNELGRDSDETQHQVTLTHGIYVQTTEVTNQRYMELAQWAYDHGYVTATDHDVYDNLDGSRQILKQLGAEWTEMTFSAGVFSCVNPTHPVKWVNWYGAVAYCDWLSMQQGLPRAYSHSTWQCNSGNPYTATGYRLPTEAEWEYACRAGTQTPFNTGDCLDAGTEANYDGNYPYNYPYPGCPTGPYVGWTVPVGSYPANAFGLYDMHGNSWEWCNDWSGTYGGTVTDPVGPVEGSDRVLRGGSWYHRAQECRSAIRIAAFPSFSFHFHGFRPVRSAN